METVSGLEEEAEADQRKVSFIADPTSLKEITGGQEQLGNIYEGKLRKYGFRLFSNNWHSVDVTISSDGILEWVKSHDTEHRHRIDLKELPVGLLVLGNNSTDIPTYLQAKLGKGRHI